MILDLHTHSIKSDDGRAKVENYCQWIRSKDLPIDGFVLTEHRQFDTESDYSALADKFDLVILKASEVETEYGHVLVFGVTEKLTKVFDFASINLRLEMVLETSNQHGAIAVPCHPGRAISIGFMADNAINGKARRINPPVKLPRIRSTLDNSGNRMG